MAQSTYQSVVLAKRPTGLIVPGETLSLKENPMFEEKDVKDDQVLVETLYLSLDPAMRGWLNGIFLPLTLPLYHVTLTLSIDTRSYVPPVQIGEAMRGFALCKVLISKSSKFSVGDYVTCMPGWKEVAIMNAKEVTLLEVPENGRPTDALGVLGPTGLTAYFGMRDIGEVKAGDFVVVSGAAGATGSVACQVSFFLY